MSNESILKEILEQTLAGYWDWDIPSGNEYLSPSFKRMFGYEDHEIPNRVDSWQRLIFAEDLPVVFALFDAHVKSRGAVPYYHEVRYRHKNGSTIWVICTGKVIAWDDNGTPLRMVGCHIDITGRKQLEETLEKNRQYYEQLLANSFDCVVVLDEKGVQNYVSSSVTLLLGYAPEDLIGIPVIEKMIHPEDQRTVFDAFARVLRGETGCVQYRHRHKNGGWVWLEARANNLLTNPAVRGVLVSTRDITDWKIAEEKLRQEESYLATIIENQPGLVWLKDASSRFLIVNKAFAASCGRGLPEELVGKSDLDIWPRELAEKYLVDDREVMAAGEPKIVEELIADKGEARWFETFKAPVRDDKGAVIGTTGYARDITWRKQAEKEREELNTRMHQMQKLESLGVLAGGIAHDFNNLLGGIFGNIDLAAAVFPGAKVPTYLAAALGAIDRARSLTRQLLTFAKGGVPVKNIERLSPFIQETVQFALSGSAVSALFSIERDLWPCDIDRNQIGQVIDNIVINAVQAMAGGGTVEIAAVNIEVAENRLAGLLPGPYVKITVTDHGIGIPKEALPKIFDPFFTTKQKGHGLGLATCYSIVNRHGGCIEVESEPGKGSAFSVFLPARPTGAAVQTGNAAKSHCGTGTFLVMDDEEIIRMTAGEILKSMGYSISYAIDGKEAVDFFREASAAKKRVAGAIFDLTIPGGMSGREAVARIREFDRTTPIYVASGYADDPVMAAPETYGFNGSIPKPFMIVDLAALLNRKGVASTGN
jgi:PAS domain S-box-containing protein